MTYKRSRENYEADLISQQSPYAIFGTPLPPRDPDVRDDGSYVPVWKQEVRDERGLKRLHGAFTGGFSAGYFNTVGSKEGWTPSTFVSSRSNPKKNTPKAEQQRPEDFMDDEDIRDAEDARKIETSAVFSGLGSTNDDVHRKTAFMDLFRKEGETIGVKLLQKMGWKEGQGVGPKVRRPAQLGETENSGKNNDDKSYLFAPKNTEMIKFAKKNNYQGLGYTGESNLRSTQDIEPKINHRDEDEDVNDLFSASKISRNQTGRGGFGVGILNDTGSDDEDPFEIGPRISYNRVIGGDKKKKKKPSSGATSSKFSSKPVFISKKAALAKAALGFRKCHDGRLPLDGFILGSDNNNSLCNALSGKFNPPEVPKGWKSSKQPNPSRTNSTYLSTSDAAKLSKLDPKSRASILGETTLPGKSVFDFLSPAARDRLAAASGKEDLPPALGEINKEYRMNEVDLQKELLTQIPVVDSNTANAALSRGASGFMPYNEDEGKRTRYRLYLEYQSGISKIPPIKDPAISSKDWLQELHEFANCARIFKPISGTMATRFTSSASTVQNLSASPSNTTPLCRTVPPKPEDPAEEAAKLSMYGPLTRSLKDWYPTRLLCKRFNVKPPANFSSGAAENPEEKSSYNMAPDLVSQSTIKNIIQESYLYQPSVENQLKVEDTGNVPEVEKAPLDTGWNEALEGKRAGEAAFRAIFGDDSDED
ncbi:hypothetical protein K3495_g8223 [Podosphaera aphanis]|nr:hypothetical protein K3495_g8223 [Podosphaera aphanis]